jgi:hypothetical protein
MWVRTVGWMTPSEVTFPLVTTMIGRERFTI